MKKEYNLNIKIEFKDWLIISSAVMIGTILGYIGIVGIIEIFM